MCLKYTNMESVPATGIMPAYIFQLSLQQIYNELCILFSVMMLS